MCTTLSEFQSTQRDRPVGGTGRDPTWPEDEVKRLLGWEYVERLSDDDAEDQQDCALKVISWLR